MRLRETYGVGCAMTPETWATGGPGICGGIRPGLEPGWLWWPGCTAGISEGRGASPGWLWWPGCPGPIAAPCAAPPGPGLPYWRGGGPICDSDGDAHAKWRA